MSELTITKRKLSVKVQAAAAVVAVIGAVALPQIFHAAGAALGIGSALGESLLPMHLPIILVGLLAGPFAGAIAGVLAPLVSFAMTGMPASAMLPFMMLELFCYGLFSGLLKETKLPALVKLLAVQTGGRAVRAAAILLSVYAIGNTEIQASVIWTSIIKGLPGLALQWCLIPLVLMLVESRSKNER